MGKIKDQAMDYFSRISDGHGNAIQRPWNRVVDRCLRKMIERANNNGDCIINVGNGIYRPIPGDPVDEKGAERVSCERAPPGAGDTTETSLYEENI